MPTQQGAINTFVNAVRQNVRDIVQRDIDGNEMSFRASKSYWIDEGDYQERWVDYQLPQISIFHIGGGTEGQDTKDKRWELMMMQIDVIASGKGQRNELVGDIKTGFFDYDKRASLLASGVNFAGIASEYELIEDAVVAQDVFRKQLTFKVYINSSGA
jgi:hypothetical protein